MSSEIVQKPADLLKYLDRHKNAIAMALPKHLTPDRMMRLALTAFSTTPALRKCTPQSILSSVVVASQIGLEIGIAGQGYLIPYKDTATFVPGWQGLVGLLNNTGRATAWTGAVFEGDTFDFQLGSTPRCYHVPGPNYGDPEKIEWVYACGKVNGSEQPVIEAWPMSRVWKHRDQFNKVGKRHYSYEHPEMYARKVVLLQVLKYMPRSIELNNAMVASDAAEMGKSSTVEHGMVVEVETVESAEEHAPPEKVNPFPPASNPPEVAAAPAVQEQPAHIAQVVSVIEADGQYLVELQGQKNKVLTVAQSAEIGQKAATLEGLPCRVSVEKKEGKFYLGSISLHEEGGDLL